MPLAQDRFLDLLASSPACYDCTMDASTNTCPQNTRIATHRSITQLYVFQSVFFTLTCLQCKCQLACCIETMRSKSVYHYQLHQQSLANLQTTLSINEDDLTSANHSLIIYQYSQPYTSIHSLIIYQYSYAYTIPVFIAL